MKLFGLDIKRSVKMSESIADLDRRMDAQYDGGGQWNGHAPPSGTAAMNLATVFNAATIRTQYLAMPPLHTYYVDGTGKKEKFKGSPVYSLLYNRPNPLMTAYSWKTAMELHAMFYNGGFSRIERDVLGRPIWIWLLDAGSGRVTPKLIDNGRKLVWRYRQLDGSFIEYPDEDIIHIPGLSFDGIDGDGVIKLASRSLYLSKAVEEFGADFFQNGMHPGGVASTEQSLSDMAHKHVKESLEGWSKPENNHKTILLESGLTWNKITFTPDEAQFLGTRQFQDVEVARWFNLPLRMLKMADASGLRNVEQITIEMITGTMLPRYIAWEQELNTKLFGNINGTLSNRFCKFTVDGLLRGDSKTRAEVNHIYRLDGIYNADEIREIEDKNPIGGDKGQEYWGQPNLAANKSNTEGAEPKEDEPSPEDDPEEGDDASK
jgi:HK97 family phage portal protein